MKDLLLSKTTLFRGISEEEVQAMLICLKASQKSYKKREMIYHMGNPISSIGMVLDGSVNIEADDIWGNKSILSHIEPGQIFGEAYACIPGEPLMVNVVAEKETRILFLNTERILKSCSNACAHHSKIIHNLLQISALKNLNLSQRIFHTSAKSIRGRLLSYFSEQVTKAGSYQFTIPFNRQQLADYLNVDRSAMSNELSKMQKDGLLEYHKNFFRFPK